MKNFKRIAGLAVCVAMVLTMFSVTAFAAEGVIPTLTVQGNATIRTVPDVAHVTFSIRTLDNDPIVSQEQNRERSNEVYAALEGIGISLEDTRTQGYWIRRHYEWVSEGAPHWGGENVFRGYETMHTIVVTLNDVDEDASLVGQVFDLSVAHGANLAGGVRFALSNEKREIVYLEALAQATQRARTRANAVAAVMGLGEIRPLTVNIENVAVNVNAPVPAPPVSMSLQRTAAGAGRDMLWNDADDGMFFEVKEMAAADVWAGDNAPMLFTPVSPGEMSVRANVAVVFTY